MTWTIGCTPETYLEFVMDVERYREVDDKLGPIAWVRREGNLTEFKFRPRLPGMNVPEPYAISQMRLTPGRHIDIRLAPLPRNLPNHLVSKFAARFAAEVVDGQTRVTRMISFHFNPLVRWMFEPTLRRTLPESVERELRLSKQILERNEPVPGQTPGPGLGSR
ncbi:MAG TPA: hypothetical protein VFM54_13205 [Micromonosporaceae bacterium]|nr:hypothetical protein [Micromonosporaceae bacterium]